MILVFLVLGIILTAIGIVIAVREDDWDRSTVLVSLISGIPIILVSLIALMICIAPITSQKAIDNKIAFYEEENQRIESSVTIIVKSYLRHEEIVYDNMSIDDVQAYLVIYPDLKSNEIVAKQIDILTSNNEKVKELKSERADISTYKWWVYFG